MGSVLYQIQNGMTKLIAYASKDSQKQQEMILSHNKLEM